MEGVLLQNRTPTLMGCGPKHLSGKKDSLKTRLSRLLHPLAGAAASIALAYLLALSFGGFGDLAAIKFYAPIAFGGGVAGWAAGVGKGSTERRLFRATIAGTLAGIAAAVLFLKSEAIDNISALAICLTLFLAAGMSAATSLTLPDPPPRPPMDPVRRQRLSIIFGSSLIVLAVCWWLPPYPWRAYWKIDIQEAAIRYWDDENTVGEFFFTIDGKPLSPEMLRRMPELKGRERAIGWPDDGDRHPSCRIGSLKWNDAITVVLEADMSWSFDAAGGEMLVLQLTPSGWIVIDVIQTWIS